MHSLQVGHCMPQSVWFDLSWFRDVDYYNAKGRLIDEHTVCATDHTGKEVSVQQANISVINNS